ncbi:hypothetical protein CBR_g54778 [Chara braunii]|uniref:Lunapark zinc ribbon domain-containing protein n=1 Tax=Chara braunii TaxID=69332 RepID=A0A388MCK8_CHABU|nr:hypothetical protein CBR_g54778 [Chara braunii]|eukprot:GBG92235.1 hypothetical protein CBR_g54778 [Chara braunii]
MSTTPGGKESPAAPSSIKGGGGNASPLSSPVRDSVIATPPSDPSSTKSSLPKKKGGFFSYIFGPFRFVFRLFRRHDDSDYGKKLESISKEEMALVSRLKQRSSYWRQLARAMILYSVAAEVAVLVFAILSTRSPTLSWQARSSRVVPVFVFPAMSYLLYVACAKYFQICEVKDKKNLEKLRNERTQKLDQLKEEKQFYAMLQLIQKYDPDPAAKAAATTALVSKLGAESGLKHRLVLDSVEGADGVPSDADPNVPRPPKTDPYGANVSGQSLRRRRNNPGAGPGPVNGSGPNPGLLQEGTGEPRSNDGGIVEFESRGDEGIDREWRRRHEALRGAPNGGFFARFAAMLVGEDPTQCYALICALCHQHNGLAKKEDYEVLTYYCPRCNHLNGNPDVIANSESTLPAPAHLPNGMENERGATDNDGNRDPGAGMGSTAHVGDAGNDAKSVKEVNGGVNETLARKDGKL